MRLIDSLKNRNPFLSEFKRAELWKNEVAHMGKNVQIFHKVSFGGEPYLIEIGDGSKITYGCKFITHDGGVYVLRALYSDAKGACTYGKIILGNNVFLGNNVIILSGVKIGDNCVVGAGAVVTKSIPANSVIAGVPARVLCNIDDYYSNMREKFLFTGDMNYEEKKKFLLHIVKDNPDVLIQK